MNSAKRLLIVDDDAITRKLLQQTLEEEGFETSSAKDASAALALLEELGLPHLVLLDLGLPDMNGFELGQAIHQMGDVPIIVVTGDGEKDSILSGISEFAEDYVTKPFDTDVLIARIRRILARISDDSYARAPVIEVDSRLKLDFVRKRILLDGKEVSLTPKELAILHNLYRNSPRYVSVEALIARLWPNGEAYEENLRVHMARLRRKVDPDSLHAPYIVSKRGSGYSFRSDQQGQQGDDD
ncbi:MAG TPA: response regulator transcription factor [Aggregatilineales bacterium]|nr:response regulator transcription factor [Aggregatilineales bacterium]